jgi:nitrite reductase/ring-hydroxylating ferredoxin subunit
MRLFPILGLLSLLLFVASCGRDECKVSFGATNFHIEPNQAYYSELNSPGGYMYFTGGHRGVIVVRLGYDRFVAYERTCPEDNSTPVEVSEEWGSTLLECPTCHSCFIVDGDGMPLDGSATNCPLYQYSTNYSGGVLWVY